MTQLDHCDYHVDKTVTAAASAGSGTEVNVDVTFEPSSIGETRTVLSLSSSVGGDYAIPLTGVCLPPKPQVRFSRHCHSRSRDLLTSFIHFSICLVFIHSFVQILKKNHDTFGGLA